MTAPLLHWFTRHTATTRTNGSYRGLSNQGATCYLNATLQVLFMTKSFRERVMRASSDTNENLVSALKKIFQELSNQYSGAPSVSTRGIITSLGIQNVNEQQDAVEYFQDILEKVDSTLAEDFSGTLRNIRKCSHHHVSHDDSPFKSLQIPVITRDGQFKLEDGLKKYFESTILVEDDQMYCNDCDEKRDTTLSIEIHEYPEILPLHLKRFEYDYRVRGFVKNDCPMDVPLHLPPEGHKYSLYAVINHTGTRFRGHYTAVIRSFTDDKWYHFNDSRVTLTDESELKGSGEAYLLLYQKNKSMKNVKKDSNTKTDKSEESVEADIAECGGAHNKPQLEEPLRILVLRRSQTDAKNLAEMILREVSPESKLWHGETIKDSLEMCSPGPHMILWLAPLECTKNDKKAFKKIYKFLGKPSKYIMTVFICKGPPEKRHIKKAKAKYAGKKQNHVLDIGADLTVQVKELVTKLMKMVDRNHELGKPIYVMKQKRKLWPHMRKKVKKQKS